MAHFTAPSAAYLSWVQRNEMSGGAVAEYSVEAVAHVVKQKNSSDVMH